MNDKRFIIPLLALCLLVTFSDLCSGKDKKSPLTVKNIVFTPNKTGGERISLFCNQSCTPELSSLEGKNPRVVINMKEVSLIQTKTRNVNTGGKLIKRIRSNLDKQTKILRIVLDMEPSKYYIVRPMQDPSGNYMLTIKEDADSPRSKEKRITILRPDLRPEEQQKGKPQEAAPSPGKLSAVDAVKKGVPSVAQGQSQLNNGDFAAAVDTFTQILAAHPTNESLIYRLRGDAYDNLGDRERALEDWTQAARLGDTIIQSSLDSQGVKWRENPAP
jgi:tetratricopeptide (TPR) repeat protein